MSGKLQEGGRVAWAMVALLLAAYAVSFVDRQIVSLLVGDLRRDLRINDFQIGLLQGPAFGIFYAVMGLPFGWLADRVNRIRLIAAGMILWSLMTALGGFASNFETLLLTRMGVGVGEAALVPAAVSLLADAFPRDRRALPLAVFTSGVSVGAGLALVLGGALVKLAQGGLGSWMPGFQPWQIVLILAGLLGGPLALVILLLPEPAKRMVGEDGRTKEGLFSCLIATPALFAAMLAGSSFLYIFSYALSAWMPTMFIRDFGWAPGVVGLRIGALVLGGALAGNIMSGLIATGLTRRGRPHGSLLTMAGGAVLLAPIAIAATIASRAEIVQIGIGLVYFALALCFGVATASFVAVTPADVRGRMSALYLSLGNLAGMGIGPPLAGFIIENNLAPSSRVGAALAMVAGPTIVMGALLLCLALPRHARRAATLQD
jgi:MFS family permease